LLCVYAIQILLGFVLFFTYFWFFFNINILKLIFLSYINLQLIFWYSLIEASDDIFFNNWFLVVFIAHYHAIAYKPLWVLSVLVLTELDLVGFEYRLIICIHSTFWPAVILLLRIIIVLYLTFIYDFVIFNISICSSKNICILLIVDNAHSINRISFI